jgi:hypothetical protein
MENSKHLSPAAYAIRIFGGVRATARAFNRTAGAVSKWSQPKNEDRQGCEGRVPGKLQPLMLERAKALGLDLTPSDLINGRTVVEKAAG